MEEVLKQGRRFTLWLQGKRCVEFKKSEGRKIFKIRWEGLGLLAHTEKSFELRFQFQTSEHEVSFEEANIAAFWETMIGLQHLLSTRSSNVLNEEDLVDALGMMIESSWHEAHLTAPVPGLTIYPIEIEHLTGFGIVA
jgi:hypothetical protein